MLTFNALLRHPTWAVLPVWLTRALGAQAYPADLGSVLPNLSGEGFELSDTSAHSIAVLPITGVILPQENGLSTLLGATTLDRLTHDFAQAMQNPAVSAILLAIDSPGGVVTGVHECAEMIYHARGKKPLTAYVSGMGASAAYWLASACDEIVLDATASVGSIGVLSMHTDDTQQKANLGLSQIQIVSSQSPKKRLDVATVEGRAEIQAHVDAIAEVFVASVARNRNVAIETVLADFGQGSLLVGEPAVTCGLADRLGSLQQLLQEKASRCQADLNIPNHKKLTHQLQKRGTVMTETRESLLASITREDLQQFAPELANALREEGVQQERARLLEIEALELSGHEALIQTFKVEGTSGYEAAKQLLLAEKASRSVALSQWQAQALTGLPITRSVEEEDVDQKPKKVLSLEEQCREDWQSDANLQAEFGGSFETYLAFMQADAKGQINWLGRPLVK